MKRFLLLGLIFPVVLAAQTPSCQQKGSLTASGTVYTPLANNTANPNCNALALTWNTTGFSAVSVQLQGADSQTGTYAAFSGTGTVIVGTNPSSALSGAIIVQASSKLAFLQVKLVSATGSGSVNFQLAGYSGVTAAVASVGGGSGCAALGGDLSGTCSAATVIGVNGASVPLSAGLLGTDGSGQLQNVAPAATTLLSRLGTGIKVTTINGLFTAGDCVNFDTDGTLLDAGFPCGTLAPPFSTITSGTNVSAAMLVGSGASLGPTGTGAITATQVPTAAGATATTNGHFKYDTTGNNLHTGQSGADSIVALTKITPGNGNCVEWLNSGGTLNLGDTGSACGAGGGGGGGVISYSSSADSLSGTQFLPPGGGAPASSTESDVQVPSPAAATISNLHVQISSALGIGNSAAFTWRDAGSSTTSTCTISGGSATSCSDTTHSFNAAAGDLLDMQVVTTGVVTPVNVLFTSAFGTSNVGVTQVFGNSGPVVGATGDINATGRVEGINSVPLCTGFTPINGQNLQYTTASSPNPCYTAATVSGPTVATPYITVSGVTYGPVWAMTPPGLLSGWTWVNQGSATADNSAGNSLTIIAPASAADSAAFLFKSAPATPYAVYAKMAVTQNGLAAQRCGIAFRESGTSKLIVFPLYFNPSGSGSLASGVPGLSVDKYTNATTYAGSSYVGTAGPFEGHADWQRMVDDGTNLTFSVCSDNLSPGHCVVYATSPRNNFFTTGPNQIGFYSNPINATYGVSCTLLDWTIGAS